MTKIASAVQTWMFPTNSREKILPESVEPVRGAHAPGPILSGQGL